MLKRYKNILFLFAVIVLLFTVIMPVLALEIDYPILKGAPEITGGSSLTQYILYFFIFALVTAGAIGVISIVIGGIQILTAAGNPSAVGAAKDRILGSILGIILLMFSVVLLRTINPELIAPQTSESLPPPGVYIRKFAGGGLEFKQAPDAVSDTTNAFEIDPAYSIIFYNCTPTPGNRGKTLLVRAYFEKGYGAGEGGTMTSIPCGNRNVAFIQSPVLSFKWEYEDAGVYYYLREGCDGVSSDIQKSTGEIPLFGSENIQNINRRILSIRIVSGEDKRTRYGVVLKKEIDEGGECSPPIINAFPGSVCYSGITLPKDLDGKDFSPLSAKIITQKPGFFKFENQVTLYSDSLYTIIQADDIGYHYTYYGNPDDLFTNPINPPPYPDNTWTGAEPFDDECTPFDPIQPCLDALDPEGNYYTILYAKNDIDENKDGDFADEGDYTSRACKIFNNGFSGLRGDDLLDYDRELYRLDIIPES